MNEETTTIMEAEKMQTAQAVRSPYPEESAQNLRIMRQTSEASEEEQRSAAIACLAGLLNDHRIVFAAKGYLGIPSYGTKFDEIIKPVVEVIRKQLKKVL